jgi:hypothetical protein
MLEKYDFHTYILQTSKDLWEKKMAPIYQTKFMKFAKFLPEVLVSSQNIKGIFFKKIIFGP